jgi:beta-N-acetylhexosaminidase
MEAMLALIALLASYADTAARVQEMTPRAKAAMLVVSSPPVPRGAAGVLLHYWETGAARPRRALVFVDQEGGPVRAYRDLPPSLAAAEYTSPAQARRAGRHAGRALRNVGVHVDLAPVLDSADGPLGSRHFRRPSFGLAFARGLARAGVAACAKHFPGLGSTAVSTDSRRPVRGVVRSRELRAFRQAIDADVPCVMMSHAIYERFGPRPASLEPEAYEMLRGLDFDGVVITDELGVLGAEAGKLARRAIASGADLVLYSSPSDARRAVDALLPLARRGALDRHAFRVLLFRQRYL